MGREYRQKKRPASCKRPRFRLYLMTEQAPLLCTDETERLAGFKADWATVLDPHLSVSLFLLISLLILPQMKLKQLPDDFHVEEMTDVAPADRGPFALYRLEKRGWSTPDALAALRRRWRLGAAPHLLRRPQGPPRLDGPVSDHFPRPAPRPAPPRRHGDAPRLDRRPVHVARHPLQPLPADAARPDGRGRGAGGAALERVPAEGVPNYFDDQRFGSVAGEGRSSSPVCWCAAVSRTPCAWP